MIEHCQPVDKPAATSIQTEQAVVGGTNNRPGPRNPLPHALQAILYPNPPKAFHRLSFPKSHLAATVWPTRAVPQHFARLRQRQHQHRQQEAAECGPAPGQESRGTTPATTEKPCFCKPNTTPASWRRHSSQYSAVVWGMTICQLKAHR